jgi:hypothetical protein
MSVQQFLSATLLLLISVVRIQAQPPALPDPEGNHDPEKARLITGDIPNFWRVFDRASLKDAADLYQHEYIDSGSPGLHDSLGCGVSLTCVAASCV